MLASSPNKTRGGIGRFWKARESTLVRRKFVRRSVCMRNTLKHSVVIEDLDIDCQHDDCHDALNMLKRPVQTLNFQLCPPSIHWPLSWSTFRPAPASAHHEKPHIAAQKPDSATLNPRLWEIADGTAGDPRTSVPPKKNLPINKAVR